jgi:CRP-like cAMP-binding protein
MASVHIRPLIHKIRGVLALTNEEEEALASLPIRLADLTKGDTIVREGDRPTQCCIVIGGVTCMYKYTGDGKRQILILHFAGDVPDLQSLHLNVLDIGIAALSRATVAFVQHEHIRRLYARFPRIGDVLWRSTLVDASILREWMLNIGQRPAHARMAHFFCEIVIRMKLAGLDDNGAYPVYLTQREIGDALGLSNVHVNRVALEMREQGLVGLTRGKLVIPDWNALKEAADFDFAYLHLTQAQKSVVDA